MRDLDITGHEPHHGRHGHLDESFDRLLLAWNRHQDLRRSGAPVRRLWASRIELDQRRQEVRARDDHAA